MRELNLLPNFPVTDSILSKVQFIKKQLISELAKGEIDQLIDTLGNKSKENNTSFLTELTQIYQKYDEDYSSNSYKNAEGKTEYELMLWNRMNIFIQAISNTEKYKHLDDMIAEPEFAYLAGFYQDSPILDLKGSQLLKMIFNQDGTRKEDFKGIEIYNYNGLQSGEVEGEITGKKTKSLYTGDKAIMDIAYLNKYNIYPTVQLGDKSSFFSVGLQRKLANK